MLIKSIFMNKMGSKWLKYQQPQNNQNSVGEWNLVRFEIIGGETGAAERF